MKSPMRAADGAIAIAALALMALAGGCDSGKAGPVTPENSIVVPDPGQRTPTGGGAAAPARPGGGTR